jgi:hypothetical protein
MYDSLSHLLKIVDFNYLEDGLNTFHVEYSLEPGVSRPFVKYLIQICYLSSRIMS